MNDSPEYGLSSESICNEHHHTDTNINNRKHDGIESDTVVTPCNGHCTVSTNSAVLMLPTNTNGNGATPISMQSNSNSHSLVQQQSHPIPATSSISVAASMTHMECGQCLIDRPITASHCYECGLCVDKIDHHCPVRLSHLPFSLPISLHLSFPIFLHFFLPFFSPCFYIFLPFRFLLLLLSPLPLRLLLLSFFQFHDHFSLFFSFDGKL